jgi:hypothetical protein
MPKIRNFILNVHERRKSREMIKQYSNDYTEEK